MSGEPTGVGWVQSGLSRRWRWSSDNQDSALCVEEEDGKRRTYPLGDLPPEVYIALAAFKCGERKPVALPAGVTKRSQWMSACEGHPYEDIDCSACGGSLKGKPYRFTVGSPMYRICDPCWPGVPPGEPPTIPASEVDPGDFVCAGQEYLKEDPDEWPGVEKVVATLPDGRRVSIYKHDGILEATTLLSRTVQRLNRDIDLDEATRAEFDAVRTQRST